MKLLLLCLGLILVHAHEEENDVVKGNFDISKISGDWYSILLASDIKEKIEENGSMRVFVKDIEVLSNSSLIFTMHTKVNGKCTKISLICNKTEKDGEYDVVHDGYNLFRIIETAYEDYIIFHLNNVNQEQEFQLMELYGRKPDVSPKVKEKFVRYCQGMEIPKENILDLTQVVLSECFLVWAPGSSLPWPHAIQ
uniref:Uncharacterized protein n=2 Tax=Canis lupus familiaris TaxID=9615 RepID=A0A8I3N4Y9_CANLF